MLKKNRKKSVKPKEEKEEIDGLKMPFIQAMSFLAKQPDKKDEDQSKETK